MDIKLTSQGSDPSPGLISFTLVQAKALIKDAGVDDVQVSDLLLQAFESAEAVQRAKLIRAMSTFLVSVGSREWLFHIQSQDAMNWARALANTKDEALKSSIVVLDLGY